MDISAFTTDIDELLEAFVEIGGLELSQMKDLWRSRSFSFIHEAKPSQVDPTFFMQALYSCTLDFMQCNATWSKRLGGLYMLYILYETQLIIPPIKIYLSTVDLENIYSLVNEAKVIGPLTALRVMNRMMVKDFFLYGSVNVQWKKTREAFRNMSNKAVERVQQARTRIFASSSAKQHFEGNLIKDLDLDAVALLNKEYVMAKQRVYMGGAQSTEDVINNLGSTFGNELKEDVNKWMEDRKRFSEKQEDEHEHMELKGKKGQDTESEMNFKINGGLEEEGFEDELERFESEMNGGLEEAGFEDELERVLDED